MQADLDTLVIALYVTIDELLGPRRGPGRPPRRSDAELVCLAVAQVLVGFGSERRWLRFAGRRLGHLVPYLPTPSADNRRLRRAAGVVTLALDELARRSPTWWDDLRLVDSTRCRARPAARRSSVRRWPAMPAMATASATTATSGAFACMSWPPPTGCRSPGAWPPKLGEREVVAAMLDHERARLRPGLVILGDRGLPGRSSSNWSPSMGPGCYVPTVLMSPAGTARWAGGGRGSRAPLTPSKTSSGWNATAAAPWPGSMSGPPSGCSPWPAGSGGTGRSASPTSAPWSPTTIEPTTQSEAIS